MSRPVHLPCKILKHTKCYFEFLRHSHFSTEGRSECCYRPGGLEYQLPPLCSMQTSVSLGWGPTRRLSPPFLMGTTALPTQPTPTPRTAQGDCGTRLLPGTSLPGHRLAAPPRDTCPLLPGWVLDRSFQDAHWTAQPQSPDPGMPGGSPDPPSTPDLSLKKSFASHSSMKSVSHPQVILELTPNTIASAALGRGSPGTSCPTAAGSQAGKSDMTHRPFTGEHGQGDPNSLPSGREPWSGP